MAIAPESNRDFLLSSTYFIVPYTNAFTRITTVRNNSALFLAQWTQALLPTSSACITHYSARAHAARGKAIGMSVCLLRYVLNHLVRPMQVKVLHVHCRMQMQMQHAGRVCEL